MTFKYMVAFLMILLFAYTGTSKLLEHDKFVYQMKISPVHVVHLASPVLSYLVPAIEIALVIYLSAGLFFNKNLRSALIASTVLIIIFEMYIIIMLLSGLDLPCSCGGVIAQMSWKQHVIFNGFYIIAGISAIVFDGSPLKLESEWNSSQ